MKKKNTQKGIIYVLILIILIVGGLYLKEHRKNSATPLEPENNTEQATDTAPKISITSEAIKEENFSGSRPVIEGDSMLVEKANAFVKNAISEFKKEADTDVPDMRDKFGADAPMASYTIDISASVVDGAKTQSIVLSQYTYTGGANGNSLYEVFTANISSGKILTLGSVIKKDKQTEFTNLVKKELNTWRPEGSTTSVIFPDEVKNLTFSSFANWSLDDKNLNLYFAKYDIGPGVLGAIVFPIKLDKLKDFLEPSYK